MDQLLRQTEEKFKAALEHLELELGAMRSGRANAALVDSLKVNVYGQEMMIKAIATVIVLDAKTIQIQPWDQANIAAIEKTISEHSQLGLTPSNDGRIIRLNVPPLNEETRSQMVKVAREKAENTNVSMRNARHEAINMAKIQQKANQLTQDQVMKLEKDLNALIEKYHQRVQQLLQDKEKDLMAV